jgi:Zn finger protein HypA/HybF involved in hydrogenase expression
VTYTTIYGIINVRNRLYIGGYKMMKKETMSDKEIDVKSSSKEHTCPDCGAQLVPESGCIYCPFCGYSECH